MHQQDAYPTNARVQLKLCGTHRSPFQRQHFHRSLYAFIYSTQGTENDVSAGLPNITLASCDLDFGLLTPEVDRSCTYPWQDLWQFALKSVHWFSKYSVHKLVTDERMNKQTDEETAQEHYVSDQSRLAYG